MEQQKYVRSRPTSPGRVIADALPLLTLLLGLAWWFPGPPPVDEPPPAPRVPASPPLDPLTVKSADDLRGVFDRHGYAWPPKTEVPPLGLAHLPRGLDALRIPEKKSAFFRALLPLVLAENARIRRQRQFLQEQFVREDLSPQSSAWDEIQALAERYSVEGDLADPTVRQRLLERVDVVPPALVLAQAANESGWGTSRFALQANNLFGEWTFDPAHGLKPKRRDPGRRHLVRVFPDLQSAVRAYLHNLNTGRAYAGLRQTRAAMRQAGSPLDPVQLAAGLRRYSARGEAYVREIRAMIRGNRLDQLGPWELAARD